MLSAVSFFPVDPPQCGLLIHIQTVREVNLSQIKQLVPKWVTQDSSPGLSNPETTLLHSDTLAEPQPTLTTACSGNSQS